MKLIDAVELTKNEEGTKYTKTLSIREKESFLNTKKCGFITDEMYDYCERHGDWDVRVICNDKNKVVVQLV